MLNRLFQVVSNVKALSDKSVFVELFIGGKLSKFILDLNRYNQLFDKGIDSKGLVLG